MQIHRLIIPLGITAYTCLFLSVMTGILIMKYHVRWIKMKLHAVLGIVALLLATIHAGVVIYLNR